MRNAGLSNILDGELNRRKPVKRSQGEVVGAAVTDSELFSEVVQGIKAMAEVKAFLVLPVAALHLTVVARGMGTDKFVADSQFNSCFHEQGRAVLLSCKEVISESQDIVGLDALHLDAPAGAPLEQPFQKVGERIGTLFRIDGQEAQTVELVNASILEQG